MVYCVAFGCSNSHRDCVSFHTFPKEKSMLRKWLDNVKRKGFRPSSHSRLCGAHFEDSAFITSPKLLKSLGRKCVSARLKPDAVPTIFSFSQPSPTITDRSNRLDNRKRIRLEYVSLSETPANDTINVDTVDTGTTSDCPVPEKELGDNCHIPSSCGPTIEAEVKSTPFSTITFVNSIEPVPKPSTCTFESSTQTNAKHITRNVKIQVSKRTKSKTTQYDLVGSDFACQYKACPLTMRHVAIQCERFKLPSLDVLVPVQPCETENAELTEDPQIDAGDHEWQPEWDRTDTGCGRKLTVSQGGYSHLEKLKEKKYLVFESELQKALSVCRQPHCVEKECSVRVICTTGTMAVFESVCKMGHQVQWSTQPEHRGMPLGNLCLAACVFFSGTSVNKALNMMKQMNMVVFSQRTYFNIQTSYLVPAVMSTWRKRQSILLQDRKGDLVHLGGDGRCCSPGHTAKYGSYSLMDLKTSTVLDVQLVQSSEVNSSNAMELEGLQRSLRFLEGEGLQISDLTTDRHLQVKKFMRTTRPEIKHWFDVWHVAKGVYKKLQKVGSKKKTEVVGEWARSISNHLYWCASSSGGNEQLVKAKWLSISRHVTNVHEGHGEHFQRCLHRQLDDREWLTKGSKAHKDLVQVIEQRNLMSDIGRLSPNDQTYSLESYHKIVCSFAPKMSHFFHESMEARLYLAVLHFNENCGRKQAETKQGALRWSISYPKQKKGVPVAKEVKVKASYTYVDDLLKAVMDRRIEYPSYSMAKQDSVKAKTMRPVPVANNYNSDKPAVVQSRVSRFNKMEYT